MVLPNHAHCCPPQGGCVHGSPKPCTLGIQGMLHRCWTKCSTCRQFEKSDDSQRKSNFKLFFKATLADIKAITNTTEGNINHTGELPEKLVRMRDDLEDAWFAQTVHHGDRGHA